MSGRLPFDLTDSGVRCKHCGTLIDCMGVNWADASLPDPLPITCPFCNQVATYPKSSIQTNLALRNSSPKTMLFYALAIVALALVVASVRYHVR